MLKFFQNFRQDLTRKPLEVPSDLLINILKSPLAYDTKIPCSIIHLGNQCPNCSYALLQIITKWYGNIWKLFLAAHLLPVIIYKRKEAKQRPFKIILRVILNFLRSQAFILTHAAIQQLIFCKPNLILGDHNQYRPSRVWLVMFPLTGSIFFEATPKMEETMMYCLPRFMNLAWNY